MAKVADTAYYDTLGVPTTATQLDIKKAYRRLAIVHHPDKNPGDATAHEKFQAIGEAYQVLSNTELRKRYDKYGKEKAVPDSGFEDPSEFFSMIFGGDAFVDLIGEISLMRDLSKTVEIATKEEEQEGDSASHPEKTLEVDSGASKRASVPSESTTAPGEASTQQQAGDGDGATVATPSQPSATTQSPSASGTSTPRQALPIRPALMDRSDEDARAGAIGATDEEKELRAKEKKKGNLSKEQREELAAFEKERRRVREERIETLSKKLIDRISIWTETDKGPQVTHAFEEKVRLEVENLKMESFGIEILHAIGTTYLQKATSFLKSQKFLGISGFFSRLKDKGTLVKETWTTVTTALEAQTTMEEMAKLEEKGGADWTDEKRAEYEKRVTGKVLAAAWKGSKFEIQSVLREVCDKVLNDRSVSLAKRVERANALAIAGTIYHRAERDPDEEGEYMAFEQLMAEAAAKKGKDDDKKKGKSKSDEPASSAPHSPHHHHHHHRHHSHEKSGAQP